MSRAPVSQTIELSKRFELVLKVFETNDVGGKHGVEIQIVGPQGLWATGAVRLGTELDSISIVGASVVMTAGASRFAVRFIAATDRPAVQVVERCRGPVQRWQWQFVGDTVHTHKQLSVVSSPAGEAQFRMGAFTQYGQIFDLKDWAAVDGGGTSTGLVAVRVGKWSHPSAAIIYAHGTNLGLTLDVRWTGKAKRSYILFRAPTSQVTALTKLGIEYFEPPQGHAAWPAAIIARFGAVRPERVAAVQRMTDAVNWLRPTVFLYGEDRLQRAFDRAVLNPLLAQDEPLWARNYDAAKQQMFDTLQRLSDGFHSGAFLNPSGNPVAVRPFALMCVKFHILDYLDQLTDQERVRGAHLIAGMAELAIRPDFYPHNYAAEAPEYPYSDRSFYRGMLNQNFNTDWYVLVGMAGCVLPAHPRSKTWRRHAVAQFASQMRAYVWPGGAWEESHTYANHVKLTLLPMVFALRNAPEQIDLMQDPRFRATCRFFVPLLSPPDAVIGGARGIPAVGDHGYLHAPRGDVFGWLATACDAPADPDRSAYLWAWRSTVATTTGPGSLAVRLLNPMLLPEVPIETTLPAMPRLMDLPGYGAALRGGIPGEASETLLVARCGQSWAHYQCDQGSFWWWVNGRLICCDSDLGDGELKFIHRGHSLISYPGREPFQHLDRTNYHVDRCEPIEQGGARIRCQIPIVAWGQRWASEQRLAVDQRPHNVRTYTYDFASRLVVIDEPTNSPDKFVLWCLHVPCESALHVSARSVVFKFGTGGGELHVDLPIEPVELTLDRTGKTMGLYCRYEEQKLRHVLRYVSP